VPKKKFVSGSSATPRRGRGFGVENLRNTVASHFWEDGWVIEKKSKEKTKKQKNKIKKNGALAKRSNREEARPKRGP